MKNIPKYTINIYEINTENYYKQNLAEFDTDIEIDGIHPNFK